jgi:predicted P-loop ATPase
MTKIIKSNEENNLKRLIPLYGKERLKIPVSIVKGTATKITKKITLSDLLQLVQDNSDDKTKDAAHIARLANENPQEYKKQKNNLDGFLIGEFNKRANNGLVKYIPLLVFDIDKLELFQYVEILKSCKKSPFVFAAFPSPSYNGCRIMVWSDSTAETHKAYYQKLIEHLSTITGLTTDKTKPHIDKATSNYSRHWYFTAVGSDFYYNENSQIFSLTEKTDQDQKIIKKVQLPKQDNLEENQPLTDGDKFKLIAAVAQHRGKTRNLTVFELSCNLFEWGLDKSTVQTFCVSNFQELHTSDKFDKSEIEKTVNSACKTVSSKNNLGTYTDSQIFKYCNEILTYQTVNNILDKSLPKANITPKNARKTATTKSDTSNKTNNKTTEKSYTKLGDKIPKIIKIKNYLMERYKLRYNTVSNEFEARKDGKSSYEVLNENNLIVALLEQGLAGVESPLIALLKSDFVQKYDPIFDYCENLPKWTPNEPDYITELANYVKAHDQHWFNSQFKKMMVRMLACGLGRIAFNKQCFTLVGGQNAGKSSFIRFLCPKGLGKYITDDIDFQNKDGRISLCTNLIINLDELGGMPRKEINLVKKFMTIDTVKARLPYDRTDTFLKRTASFFASTNDDEFLTDTTGNVRWLVFPIKTILHDNGGKNGYTKNIDIEKVYSQAYYLLNDKNFKYLVDKSELEQSEVNNKQHMVTTIEQDIIQEYLEPSDKENGEFGTGGMLFSKISGLVTINLNSRNFGRALRVLDFVEVSYREDGKVKKGYWYKFSKKFQT